MDPMDGGTLTGQIVDSGQRITRIAPREAARVSPVGAASPQSDSMAVSPASPLASPQSAYVFTLLVDQQTNRLIMEWNDRASGQIIGEIPVKTAAKVGREVNVPASSSEYVDLQI